MIQVLGDGGSVDKAMVVDEDTMPAAGLDTTPGTVKVSGTLVPTSEVERLCYPAMELPPKVTPPSAISPKLVS